MKMKLILALFLFGISIQTQARFISYNPNFASQGLWNGGWINTTIGSPTSDAYWYFVSSSQYSQTWSVANALYRHFANGYEGWYGGNYSTINLQANYGDIIFADWTGDGIIDHAMYVTGFFRRSDGSLEPRLSYHSTDRKDMKWSDFYNMVINNPPYTPPKFYKFSYYSYPVTPPSSRIY